MVRAGTVAGRVMVLADYALSSFREHEAAWRKPTSRFSGGNRSRPLLRPPNSSSNVRSIDGLVAEALILLGVTDSSDRITQFTLSQDESLEGAISWFAQFGPTDTNYLRSHFDRFKATREFALADVPAGIRLKILDVGAHWLHNAFFYANRGHHLIVTDAVDTLERSAVREAAKKMGAEIRLTTRMEKGDSLVHLPDDSVDIVLFCEVIEHLAFNPIPFWKHVYRALKPGGHIIITTPNAFYHRSLKRRIERMMRGECIGLAVSEIMSVGTHGHHWKEFTLGELREYFGYLSPDFDTSRSKMLYRPGEKQLLIAGDLETVIQQNVDIRAYNIFLDVALPVKADGIKVRPPWEPS